MLLYVYYVFLFVIKVFQKGVVCFIFQFRILFNILIAPSILDKAYNQLFRFLNHLGATCRDNVVKIKDKFRNILCYEY